jgi:hypothetical protein
VGQSQKKSSIRSQIDENLRRVYQETLEEGVPDRFSDLLRQLAEQDRTRDDQRS